MNPCSVCSHPQRVAIDRLLAEGQKPRAVARVFHPLTHGSIGRHAKNHTGAPRPGTRLQKRALRVEAELAATVGAAPLPPRAPDEVQPAGEAPPIETGPRTFPEILAHIDLLITKAQAITQGNDITPLEFSTVGKTYLSALSARAQVIKELEARNLTADKIDVTQLPEVIDLQNRLLAIHRECMPCQAKVARAFSEVCGMEFLEWEIPKGYVCPSCSEPKTVPGWVPGEKEEGTEP